MGSFSKMLGLVVVAFIVYVVFSNNMISVDGLKSQFVDPYVTPDIVYTVQNFIDVTMNVVKNFNLRV
jgi:hypothetical protein